MRVADCEFVGVPLESVVRELLNTGSLPHWSSREHLQHRRHDGGGGIGDRADWDDRRRRERLAATRIGRDWVVFGRLRRVLVVLALGVMPLLVVGGVYWTYDVVPEQRRLAQTEPRIDQIYDAADPADSTTAVVDIVGLGNVDAAPTAQTLTSFTQIGRVWSVTFDNRGIDTEVISEMVARRARTAGVRNIVLVGHSMGGVVALEVAQHLYEDTDTILTGVVLDCTPLDLHAVRGEARGAGEDLLRWIGWLPGARESRTLRSIVEMAARKDRYVDMHSEWYPQVDVDAARKALRQVMIDKILNPSAASNGFIESQFRTIVASGALDNLDALAQPADNKPRPAIVFMRPARAKADHVVDVDYSQRILLDRSGGPGGTLRVVRMHGTGHANPRQAPETYNSSITSRVLPLLEETVARHLRSSLSVDPVPRAGVPAP